MDAETQTPDDQKFSAILLCKIYSKYRKVKAVNSKKAGVDQFDLLCGFSKNSLFREGEGEALLFF